MGVYIKGMEMPESCPCKLVSFAYDPYCSFTSGVLSRMREYIECCEKETRPDWCPLAEIPTPHGDLIDRTELMKTLEIAEECENCESHVGIHCAKESFVDACEAICDAPTIIGEEGAP